MSKEHLTDDDLQAYITGESEIRNRFEDHLNNCRSCRIQLILYKQVVDTLDRETGDIFSNGLEDSILNTIKNIDPKNNTIKDILFYLVPAAAGFLAASILFMKNDAVSIWSEILPGLIRDISSSLYLNSGVNNTDLFQAGILVIFLIFLLIYSKIDRIFFNDKLNNSDDV